MIRILTENRTRDIYTYDHSDPICNRIPTSAIYSLTQPGARIHALGLFSVFQSPGTFCSWVFNFTPVLKRIAKTHTTCKSKQLATQCLPNRRIDFLYAVLTSWECRDDSRVDWLWHSESRQSNHLWISDPKRSSAGRSRWRLQSREQNNGRWWAPPFRQQEWARRQHSWTNSVWAW